MTNHEFEATPIRLPNEAQEKLVVAETAAEPTTVTRKPGVGGIEGKVTITSHGAVNQRGPARGQPTLIEKYLGRVNGTEGAGAAVVATASEVGLDEVTYPGAGNEYTLPGDQVSIVAPAGLRGEDAPFLPLMLGWMTDNAIQEAETDQFEKAPFAVDAAEVFPGLVYDHGQEYDPMKEWMPAGVPWPSADYLSEGMVLVTLGDNSPEDVFGVPAEEMPGERLEKGESLQPFNPFLVAAPKKAGDWPAPDNFYRTGIPTWVGGATYGMSVLSTPAAEVAGQSVNPVSGMGFEELLTSDQARGLLKQAGVTDADEVEWLAGPTPLLDYPNGSIANPSPVQASILGQKAPLKSFLGVVSGEDGPFGVGVHLARVDSGDADIIITAGVHRWPVSSADTFQSRTGQRYSGILGSIITEARGLTAAADQRLRPITY